MKKLLPLAVFLAFTGFCLEVIVREGYFGFVRVALRDGWGLAILLDLGICLCFVGAWMRRDARERGLSATPYLAVLPFLGSVGALAYLVRRAFSSPRPLDSDAE